jgi:hypothetical protein
MRMKMDWSPLLHPCSTTGKSRRSWQACTFIRTHTLGGIVFSCILAHHCDFTAALEVATNIKETLSVIKTPERYSGVSASILKASVGETSHILPISRLLEVWFTHVFNTVVMNFPI